VREFGPSGLGWLGENNPVEPQGLAHRPRLPRTTARCVWFFGIGDFGDMTEAGFFKMVEQGLEIFAARFGNGTRGVFVNPNPRINERFR
jgi:hypothetical protein